MKKEQINVHTTSPLFVLFVIFLVLKLTETVDWSWWIVTAPLWGGVVIFLSIMAIVYLLMGLTWVLLIIMDYFQSRKKQNFIPKERNRK